MIQVIWNLPWKGAEDSKIIPEIREFKIKVSREGQKIDGDHCKSQSVKKTWLSQEQGVADRMWSKVSNYWWI